MKQLLILDSKNYTEDMKVLEKVTVRAIISDGDRYAMQRGYAGEYKIPGGGEEGSEGYLDTLIREVREETGLLVEPSTVQEIGEILEVRRDIFQPEIKYVCHSYFYQCKVKPETVALEMTESEIRKGFHLEWATLEEILEANAKLLKEDSTRRDTEFIKLLLEGTVTLV